MRPAADRASGHANGRIDLATARVIANEISANRYSRGLATPAGENAVTVRAPPMRAREPRAPRFDPAAYRATGSRARELSPA